MTSRPGKNLVVSPIDHYSCHFIGPNFLAIVPPLFVSQHHPFSDALLLQYLLSDLFNLFHP